MCVCVCAATISWSGELAIQIRNHHFPFKWPIFDLILLSADGTLNCSAIGRLIEPVEQIVGETSFARI